MAIEIYDRVYVSCVNEYGCVSEIIPTGIAAIVQYRVEFADGWSGIYAEGFVQPAVRRSARTTVRLVCSEGERV